MVEHFVGRVAELWRYPVKSMLGERRNQQDHFDRLIRKALTSDPMTKVD